MGTEATAGDFAKGIGYTDKELDGVPEGAKPWAWVRQPHGPGLSKRGRGGLWTLARARALTAL